MTAGRSALSKMLKNSPYTRFGEPEEYAAQHRKWGEKTLPDTDTGRPKRMCYNLSESPLTGLSRRRDKDGKPFLSDALVHVGERLREDFELAQMGPRVAQNWDRFLHQVDAVVLHPTVVLAMDRPPRASVWPK